MCYTQNHVLKKDDSVNESKFSSTMKITSSEELRKKGAQPDGRYIVSKLAKVIKGKSSNQKSRNSCRKQNTSVPLNFNSNPGPNHNNSELG